MRRSTIVRLALGALVAFAVPSLASAQSWPTRPLKLLVGYPPGGSVDMTARTIADRLGPMLGQPVIVENRAGATGNIAADLAAKSASDGYTLYMGTSINAVSVSLFRNLPYDPVRDFAPISRAVTAPSILVVHPSVPARSVKELVAYARANPGKVTYATTGAGSSPHLCAELLSTLAGVKLVHVPYKGGAQAMTDLLSGQTAMSFSNPTSVMQFMANGQIRALAVTSRERFSETPDLPTMIESGFPEFDQTAWYGVMAPAGTPSLIVERVNAAVREILERADVRQALLKQGLVANPSTPAELASQLKSDIAMYGKLLKDAGVEPQ